MEDSGSVRIAILSDIHGNGVALDAVLTELKRQALDRIVCLGDAIQGGPQPAAVVERLRALQCPVVMGNADAWLLEGGGVGVLDPERLRTLHEARAWSLEQLDDRDRAFISRFEPTVELPVGNGQSLLCFHGSPKSYDD